MVSSAIWIKHARESFSKSIKIARIIKIESEGRVIFEVFEKLTSAYFIQISRETIHYVFSNNIHKNVRAIANIV
jgi:hypothetical protein